MLTTKQKEQVLKQLEQHNHSRYLADIDLAMGPKLEGFIVEADVLRPDLMTSRYLASWLFFNNGEYQDKSVIDMGCGSGIQGIVAVLYGAKDVVATDISSAAVANCTENVANYDLAEQITIRNGDLFEMVDDKADLIIFNHPFFPEEPIEDVTVSRSMLGGIELIHRFLDDAHGYLKAEGRIVMPYFHLAGTENNPALQGPKHGYNVVERFSLKSKFGLQQGDVSIYELKEE